MNAHEFKKLISNKNIPDDEVLSALANLKIGIGGCIARKLSAGIVIKAIRKHRPYLQTVLEMACILAGVAKNKARSQGVESISEQYY